MSIQERHEEGIVYGANEEGIEFDEAESIEFDETQPLSKVIIKAARSKSA